jgi:hypothetical protein
MIVETEASRIYPVRISTRATLAARRHPR